MKAITIWGHRLSPNPWKVIIVLKELDIPFEHRVLEFSEFKNESYININPNGRVPAIEDPNTGVKLWESGAIILYLIDQYDTEGKISPVGSPANFECKQWLMFQVSGQGPYVGQLAWFARFHEPENPSAIERYTNETERIFGVLDKALEQKAWLVGGKCTYADLSFITWSHVATGLMKQLGRPDVSKKFPRYANWYRAMESRKSVRECLDVIAGTGWYQAMESKRSVPECLDVAQRYARGLPL